jgi:hypothetical protein
VSRRPSLILPDEILHEIFSFATHVEGELVSPHWRVDDPYPPWVISSQTRRNIPLVCRQWHDVGLEYLYQHIVIFTQWQLTDLLYILDYFYRDSELRAKRLGWIRGLEFILPRDDIESTKRICGLIWRLPPGRLRLFGFEDAVCHSEKSWKLMEIVADALHKAQGSLEVLHLPCIRAEEDKGGSIYYASKSGDFSLSATGFTGFSKLRTLSLTSGRWEPCYGVRRSDQDRELLSFLTHNPHSISTIYLNWMCGAQLSRKYLDFLRSALHLQTVHIITDRRTLLVEDFDGFLEAVPHIRRLVITPSETGSDRGREPPPDVVSHGSLEEIVLVMNLSSGYKSISLIYPIFSKIQSGHLPKLKQVIVRGPYPEGCIDGRLVLSQKHSQHWKDAIQTCAEHEVDLVDEEGNAIHLWSDRHGIRIESEEEDTEGESEVSSSEEGEWWELSGSGFSGSSVESDDAISNDSEDSPYRYVSQPDLDYESSN